MTESQPKMSPSPEAKPATSIHSPSEKTPDAQPPAPTEEKKDKFYPVELEFLQTDIPYDWELYVKTGERYLLYRHANIPLTLETKTKLIENRQKVLFINCKDDREYHRFFEKSLPGIVHDIKIPAEKKATVLYRCASNVIQDVLENPRSGETMKRSTDLVQNTVNFLSSGTDAFIKMISLSSHDYYTYTHSVNVMTFGMGLASTLGVKDKGELFRIGAGGLLHDVGKSRINLKILNKPGPLTEDEWKEMKKHTIYGFEIVKDSRMISLPSKKIILNHHEKQDGHGYPKGLKADEIDYYSQIISVCDVYDAMTTTRVYAAAKTPYEAFQIIKEKMRGHFREEHVVALINLLNLKDKV